MLIKDLENPGRVIAPDETRKLRSGLVVLRPGESVGEHTTGDHEELIMVLEGEAAIEDEGVVRRVKSGQLAYIEPQRRHNVHNFSSWDLRYLYIVAPVA